MNSLLTQIRDMKNEANRLIEEANQASMQAAAKIRPIHSKAVHMASELQKQIEEHASEQARRARLAATIEESCTARALQPTAAAAVLQQYSEYAIHDAVISSNRRSGAFHLLQMNRKTQGWTAEQRLKALDSMIMAAKGDIDPGLIEFPDDWQAAVPLEDLEEFASIAAPEAYQAYRDDIDGLNAASVEADLICDAVRQAEPQLSIANINVSGSVQVQSNRSSDVSCCGVHFEAGSTTPITREQLTKLRPNQFFKTYIESGEFQLTAVDELVTTL